MNNDLTAAAVSERKAKQRKKKRENSWCGEGCAILLRLAIGCRPAAFSRKEALCARGSNATTGTAGFTSALYTSPYISTIIMHFVRQNQQCNRSQNAQSCVLWRPFVRCSVVASCIASFSAPGCFTYVVV